MDNGKKVSNLEILKCIFKPDESQQDNYLVSVNFTGEKTLTTK